MRYAVAVQPKLVVIETGSRPDCPDGAVQVSVAYVGICHSDIAAVSGGTADFPERLGHEVSGTVVSSRNAGIPVGMRVAAYVDDGCATEIVVNPDRIVPLDDGCTLLDGALAEPLACVIGGIEMLDLRGVDRVALVGAGFMGLLAARLLVARGLEVVAIDPRELSRRWAMTWGAAAAMAPDEIGVSDHRQFDCVVEASGTAGGLALASNLVGVGGVLGMLGYHQSESGRRSVDMESWNYRGLTAVSMHHRDPAKIVRWMHRAQRLSSRGIVCPAQLVDRVVSLADSPPYLAGTTLHDGVKAAVEMESDGG